MLEGLDDMGNNSFKAYSGMGGIRATEIYPLGNDLPSGADNRFGGIFASRSAGGADDMVFDVSKAGHLSAQDFRFAVNYDTDAYTDAVEFVENNKNLHGKPTKDEAEEILEYMLEEKNIYANFAPEMGMDRWNELMGDEMHEAGWLAQGLKGDLARHRGLDSVGMEDEYGESVLILNSGQIPTVRGLSHYSDP